MLNHLRSELTEIALLLIVLGFYGYTSHHPSSNCFACCAILGKGLSKWARKQFVFDDNRRVTYNISNQPVVRSESIFSTFEAEIKQLVAVCIVDTGSFS